MPASAGLGAGAVPGPAATGAAAAEPPTHLLYLHGFRSSPGSFKARRMAGWLAQHRPQVHWWCPQLPPSPAAAWRLIQQGLAHWPVPEGGAAWAGAAGAAGVTSAGPGAPARLASSGPPTRLAVVGSSLGGFYATAVAEATGCPAVLLNPAVDPARDLAAYIGEQTQFHDPEERFFFRPEYIDELRALTVPQPTRPARYAAVIAQGDEVLRWQEMVGRYPGIHLRLLPGSDHALSDFDTHLPFVLQQLALAG